MRNDEITDKANPKKKQQNISVKVNIHRMKKKENK